MYFRIILFLILIIGLQTIHADAVSQVNTAVPSGSGDIYLPVIFRPEELTPSLAAVLQITPEGWFNVSTYEPRSFRLTNVAANDQNITAVTIDVSTAVFDDMVFDPFGLAGDLVAKNLYVDANGILTGFAGHTFSSPHDDGYDALHLNFADFNPGETIYFSIDVDPTSIRGANAPGPHETGSVCGMELTGTTVTVTFADGTIITGNTYRLLGTVCGSQAIIRTDLPPAPTIQAEGVVGNTAVVTSPQQTIHVETTPWRHIRVLVIEGGLFTAGLAGGGYDIDPFEVNTALSVWAYEGYADGTGHLSLPIQLQRSLAEGGLNIITAVPENNFGYLGATATPLILHLQD